MDKLSRFFGCMYGLAIGDSIGTTVEFKERGTFIHITDMVGGGPYSLKPGQWTDDTSMALCLTESLLEKQGMDLNNQLDKYLLWLEEGHLSSTGYCFGIGQTVQAALDTYKQTRHAYSGLVDPFSAGNGSIMRLAPVALLYSYDLNTCLAMCAESSKTTHQTKEAVDGCELLGGFIYGALTGMSKDDLLSENYFDQMEVAKQWSSSIQTIAYGSYKHKTINEIESSGYVVSTLEAVLWAFYHTSSFKEGLLTVVNLGYDADTTGAVYGQIAGAFYGFQDVPESWKKKIALRDKLFAYTNGLYELHTRLAERY